MKIPYIVSLVIVAIFTGCASPACSQQHKQHRESEDCCEHKTKKHSSEDCCKHTTAQAAEEEKDCDEKPQTSECEDEKKKDEKPEKRGGIIFRGYNGVKKSFNGNYKSPHDPISQSSLPPENVRRSSTFISNLRGDYNYSHSQGTDVYVSKSYSPYTGPREDYRQSTYNNTSESYYPRPYIPQFESDSSGSRDSTVGGYISLLPNFNNR